MNTDWIQRITQNPDLMGMGHSQSAADNNLGFGWVYYGLARAYRPRHVLCIGSYRGFVPMMFAKALIDNGHGGHVTFIDPSFVDPFWTDPEAVAAWFAAHEIDNIQHHQMTTQDFVTSPAFSKLAPIDFLFVDGLHTAEQAKFDHCAFEAHLNANGLIFFHDSVSAHQSVLYGAEKSYPYSVHEYVATLKEDPDYQVLDIPFAHGLTLVSKTVQVGRDKQPENLLEMRD